MVLYIGSQKYKPPCISLPCISPPKNVSDSIFALELYLEFYNILKDKFCETEKINEALIVTYFQRGLLYEDKLKLQKKISDAIFS